MLFLAVGVGCAAENDLVIESAGDMLAKGPNGEIAAPASEVELTGDEIGKIRAGKYKAALIWAGSGEWYNAMTEGARSVFGELGIEVVTVSDAAFDPAKQATDIETTLALRPDIVLTLPVDPVSGTQVYKPVVDAGITLVFADHGVDNYEAGKQYVSIVTGDQFGMGRAAADLAAEASGGEGEIGMVWYDVSYFVTNNRDQEFERTIASKYPNLKIVSKMGFTEENATEAPTAAMILTNPNIKVIYCSWDTAAEGVLAALRAAGRNDVKVVTYDLGATNCLDMVRDGNFFGTVCDLPFDIGATMARIAAGNLIDKPAKPYYVVGLIKVDKENIAEAWKRSLNKDLPTNISGAIKK
jgi:ribose transport system substrate-binding protein